MLKELDLDYSITGSDGKIVNDFFIPSLKGSIEYNVAVAYFTSGWIRSVATGLAEFVSRGGILHWVVSPNLTKEDLEAVQGEISEEDKKSIIYNNIEKLIEKMTYAPRTMLAWMVKDGVLKIKVAVPKRHKNGLFHVKLGYFEDEVGGRVAFSGSYNITEGANSNWERVDIFTSQRDFARCNKLVEEWKEIYEGNNKEVDVYSPRDIDYEKISMMADGARPYTIKLNVGERENRALISLRPYQKEAVSSWFSNKCRGLFVMATGSGKTVTAIYSANVLLERLRRKNERLIIIICVPFQHLVEQWSDECFSFGLDTLKCYGGTKNWYGKIKKEILRLNVGSLSSLILVTTYDTLTSEPFSSIIDTVAARKLLIADEVHNAVSSKRYEMLPKDISFSLGLTATPSRDEDDEVSEAMLKEYFGQVCFEFSIADAIAHGYLTQYYYYPVICRMNQDEQDEYIDLSKKIALAFYKNSDKPKDESDSAKALLLKRARLCGDIGEKYNMLTSLYQDKPKSVKALVYCGDFSFSNLTPLEKAAKSIKSYARLRKFTHSNSMKERKEIIEMLESGDIDTVIAIKCLDEGVDIPAVEYAYLLASSTSLRQYIQRRGRVLRKSPGKVYALIYDFITAPSPQYCRDQKEKEIAKKLLEREIKRIDEFSLLAMNYTDSEEVKRSLRKEFLQ